MRVFYRLSFVSTVVTLAVFGLFMFVWVNNTVSYPNYNGSPSCDDCHPGFVGGFSGPLHGVHLNMQGNCLNCHNVTGDNPSTSKCIGCHLEFGLRAHHANAGAPPDVNGLRCVNCHPGDPTPPGENTLPPYYDGVASSITNPCSAMPAPPGEDFTGDGQGLDNDGDLVYDALDSDCGTPIEETTWGRIKALFDA